MRRSLAVLITGISFVLGAAVGAGAVEVVDPVAEAVLGEALYFEQALSINGNQACADCHLPAAGFADPDQELPVSEGSISLLFGGRNAPSAAYAAFSPFFRWDEVAGLYVGGQFWDGRANTLADQAAGPPTNPVEMALPDKAAAIAVLQGIPLYQQGFADAYGIDLAALDSTTVNEGVRLAYAAMAQAIGAFEKTQLFSPFSSKFDYVLAGLDRLTPQENRGLKLFNGKGKCALCHLSAPALAPDGGLLPPLFTDFTYDNLGIPVNPAIAALLGLPQPTDLGLGGRSDIAANDPMGLQQGKFKVMTLRNIAATAPYGHNGFFSVLDPATGQPDPVASLTMIVHFYNTRDALAVCSEPLAPGEVVGQNCWPVPEVPLNVNAAELGNLRLTPRQEADLAAFLLTLSDRPGMAPAFTFSAWPPVPMP